ncbi:MAG: DNA polymerase III subunit beta [Rickettsiales bacterium]|nr:DNA polymerase III subunit beta [Rickettsiales bacterium]
MSNLAEKVEDAVAASPIKLTIERAVILRALTHIQSVVERRGTIPILANVKLETSAGQLRLSATDMDIAITEAIAAEVGKEGATTVPAHMLYEIVRKLPDGSQIEMESSDDGKVVIKAGSSRFNLPSLPVDDFPVMSEDDLQHSFQITADECKALVEKTRFAISTEETRYYLNGVYFHATDDEGANVLRAVATDGHRLARIQIALPEGAEEIPGIIVPRKTIGELTKLIEEGVQDVEISLSETKIRFNCGQAVLVSKLIDGNFPDYDRVIPTGNDKIMEVECKTFSEAVDRVSVISTDKSRGIKLQVEPGKLTLSANSSEQGSATEEVSVKYGADAVEIGFNSRYLLDIANQIENDSAQFVLSDAGSPAIVRDPSDVGALYVIMPMRV